MLKKLLLTVLILNASPATAAEPQASPVDLKVEQTFSNVPTPAYYKYISDQGLSLDYLVNYAISHSRSIMANQEELSAGQGRLLQSGLFLNPEIEIEYGNNYIIDREGEYNFDLTYTHPLEMFGRQQSRYRLAELQFETLKNEVQYNFVQLIAEVKEAYFNAILEAENLRVTEQLLNLNRDLLELTEAGFIHGDTARFDVNLAETEINRLRTKFITAENLTRNALLRLKAAAGIDINSEIKLQSEFFTPGLIPSDLTPEKLQEMALQSRFDLRAAKLSQESSEAEIERLRFENLPVLNVIGGYSREKSIFDETEIGEINDTDNILRIGLAIELPAFNRNQGNIAEAEARLRQNRLRLEFLEQQVKKEVMVAFFDLRSASANLEIFNNQILKTARENLWITRGSYNLGEQNLIFVILEQTRLLEIQREYLDSLRQYNLSVIALERSTGLPINTIISSQGIKL